MKKAPEIGIALGAGGARGLAHLGVLQTLDAAEIPIHAVSGTSIGAIIGAMFAATQDITWMIQRFAKLLESPVYKESGITRIAPEGQHDAPGFLPWAAHLIRNRLVLSFPELRAGIVRSERLRGIVEFLLPVDNFAELVMPFSCCAVDLHAGEPITIDQGDLIDAVTASSAIPGYIAPVISGDQFLTDGGMGAPVPGAGVRKLGADYIIGVDVSNKAFSAIDEVNILSVIGRTSEVCARELARAQARDWDLNLCPDTENIHWSRFDLLDKLVDIGAQEATQALPKLKLDIQNRTGWRRFLRFGPTGA